jgi:Tol biopolymer transport system component
MSRTSTLVTVLLAGTLLGACGGGASSAAPATDPPPASVAATAAPSVAPPTTAPTEDTTVRDGEEWIAFQWLAGNGEGIFLVRRDGTGRHRIAREAGVSQIHPDWSPDGSRLAFMSESSAGQASLWVINADGTGGAARFTCERPCNWLTYPDWSADGASIYFGMDANADAQGIPSTFQVGRLDLGTGDVEVVLQRDDGMTAEAPRISPDGTQLVYMRFRDPVTSSEGSAIFVAPADGGKETRLTEWEEFGAYPDWSPDGLIVFNTRDLGAFQDTTEPANLYVIKADGTGLAPVTTFGPGETRATQPRWAPDGSGIVFTKVDGVGFGDRRLGWISADRSGLGLLTPAAFDATHGVLRPIP